MVARRFPLIALLLGLVNPAVHAATTGIAPGPSVSSIALKQLPPPRLWHQIPPTPDQVKYRLPERTVAHDRHGRALSRPIVTPQCQDMATLATQHGGNLLTYLQSLPDTDCLRGLFSLTADQATIVYGRDNLDAVVAQFTHESSRYDASNSTLVRLAYYLRAGYYLVAQHSLAPIDPSYLVTLRPALKTLVQGDALLRPNQREASSAQEVILLISNLHDELSFLTDMRQILQRYRSQPQALREPTVASAMSSLLTVMYMAHFRGPSVLSTDPSYSAALYQFVLGNRSGLVGTEREYLLADAARESLRFWQYPALAASVANQAQDLLAQSSMTGAGNGIWLAAAQAVQFYAPSECARFGTCDFVARLRDAVLTQHENCGDTIRMRAQQMTAAQFQQACRVLRDEDAYFQRMLQTGGTPVADDHNTTLEVVVFSDYANYSQYAGLIYGIDTNNGGMYLEGEPSDINNQARFVAYEASWLRPDFVIWNLTHEYIHYLDGRFDLYGNFAQSTQQPTVWWIEGLAEYISKQNANQPAIDAVRSGQYRLSQIFANTYGMADYVNRAYNWGYMATRYLFERRRETVDSLLRDLRQGRYDAYQAQITRMGQALDADFAAWAAQAGTGGSPPLPPPMLPDCPGANQHQLQSQCAIRHLAAGDVRYATLYRPAGAPAIRIGTQGGSGDVDLYLARNRYPSVRDYDAASAHPGNSESLVLPSSPQAGWIYLTLVARRPFAEVTLSATAP